MLAKPAIKILKDYLQEALYAGCPEGAYRVLKRVDFFLRGMPWGGIPCLKRVDFFFFFLPRSYKSVH